MNFSPHIHDIDPLDYRCRICGVGEMELFEQMIADSPEAVEIRSNISDGPRDKTN